jgi:acetyl esterase/lipase
MLLDDSVRAHDRALHAGTVAEIDVWPRLPHVFPLFAFLSEARDAVARIRDFVRRHGRAPVPQVSASTAPVATAVAGTVGAN